MDLIYMPEVLTYGCLKRPIFRDYEQSWNDDDYNYGDSKSHYQYRQQQERTTSKDTCHVCRENKKRTLSNYIKTRLRKDSHNEIHEEDEDFEDGEKKIENQDTTNAEKKKSTDKK